MAPRPTFPPPDPAPGLAPGLARGLAPLAHAERRPMPKAPRFQDLAFTRPSSAGRPVQTASKANCVGHLVCGPGPGRVLQVESHLERQVALVWLARPDTAELEEQVPFAWREAAGRPKTHFFDFRVTRIDGTAVALAVKPVADLHRNGFLDGMRRIAAHVTDAFAEEVRVITEHDIDPVALHNAELFNALRAPDPEADAAAEAATATLVGAATLSDLAARIGLGPRGLRALVRRVAQHRLRPLRHERITPQTLVQPKETRP